jgi:hypothetical protein
MVSWGYCSASGRVSFGCRAWLTMSLFLRGFRRVFYAALPEHVIAFYHPQFKKEYPERVKEISMTPLTKSPPGEDEGPVPQDFVATSDPAGGVEGSQMLQSTPSPPPPPTQIHHEGLLSIAQSMHQGLAAPGIGQVLATGATVQMPQQIDIQALPGQSQHDAVAALIQGQLLSLAMMQQQQQPQLQVQLSGAPHHQQEQASVPLLPPQVQFVFPGVPQGQIPLQMQLSPQVLQLLQQPQLHPQGHHQPHVLLNVQGQPHVMLQQLQQQPPQVLTAQPHPQGLPHQSQPIQQQGLQHPQQPTNQAVAFQQAQQAHVLQQLQQLGIPEQFQLTQNYSALQQLQVSQGSQQLRVPQQVATQSAQHPATYQAQQIQIPQLNLAQLGGFAGQPQLVVPDLSLQGSPLQTAIQHFAQQGLAQAWLQQQHLQQGTVIRSHDQADDGQENKAEPD